MWGYNTIEWDLFNADVRSALSVSLFTWGMIDMRKYYFICNPASRSGRGIEVWNNVEAYLKEKEIPYEILFSEAVGHVRELVKKLCIEHAEDEEVVNVIILGGDGTLDEALQGITDFDRINIGYIPTGSGNDFARYCDFGDDAIYNLKKILRVEEPKLIDIGKLEYLDDTGVRSSIAGEDVPKTHWFDVSCGIGFDAAICERVLESKAKKVLNNLKLGSLVYLFNALKILFVDKTPNAKLILEDKEEIDLKKIRFVVGMNTCYEGGGYKFSPEAVPDDGYLDVCQISNISSLGALMLIPRASKGNHVGNKHVGVYHVKSFEVKADIPLWVHTDGEVYTKSAHIRVSVEPARLRFLM